MDKLVGAIQNVIAKLENGEAEHKWTHQGACNCGLLAQELTDLTRQELHAMAIQKAGTWADHIIDYCPKSGFPIDVVIELMIDAGVQPTELSHLEHLSDPKVLAQLPRDKQYLDYRNQDHLILYLSAWVSLLQQRQAVPLLA